MAPIRLTEAILPAAARQELLVVARQVIEQGCRGEHARVRAADYPVVPREARATFVTLYVADELHGCIGSLESRRPLVEDVAHNAYAAAFDDPRFPPLTSAELEPLRIHLSILHPAEPLTFRSERELLQQLRPHVDGVVLEEGRHRSTFLPAVWEQLPEPSEFLRELKHKAGLPAHYWSPTLAVRRYTVESVS